MYTNTRPRINMISIIFFHCVVFNPIFFPFSRSLSLRLASQLPQSIVDYTTSRQSFMMITIHVIISRIRICVRNTLFFSKNSRNDNWWARHVYEFRAIDLNENHWYCLCNTILCLFSLFLLTFTLSACQTHCFISDINPIPTHIK